MSRLVKCLSISQVLQALFLGLYSLQAAVIEKLALREVAELGEWSLKERVQVERLLARGTRLAELELFCHFRVLDFGRICDFWVLRPWFLISVFRLSGSRWHCFGHKS